MKIGFIGCGNMASAIILGLKKARPDFEICASCQSEETAVRAGHTLGIRVSTNNADPVKDADFLFLAVKPGVANGVISEIAPWLEEKTCVISLMAGKKMSWMEALFGKAVKLVRTMPNTPALVGEGMTGISPNRLVSGEELAVVREMFRSFGKEAVVSEELLDVVTAVSGSSPALVFQLIEAMADAAVADGLPRDLSYRFAAQAVLGSARMVLETGEHPAVLKDRVCSPGGTTIEAIRVLEEKGLRSAVFEASKACVKKARELA